MKNITKRKPTLIIGIIIVISMLITILPTLVSAAAVTASLSRSTNTVQQGNTFTVTVNLSTGPASILDAYGRVNFNTNQLQFISASYTPSNKWGLQGSEAGLTGSYYTFDVSTTTNPRGNLSIVQLTFRALANNGISPVNLSDVEVGDGDTAPTAIHAVTSQNTSIELVEPTTPTLNTDNISTNADPNLSDEQPVPINSYVDSTGYPVEVRVVNTDNIPQVELEVKLDNQTAITDANGTVSFLGITANEYVVTAEGVESSINVITGDPSTPQVFELIQKNSDLNKLLIIGLALILLIAYVVTLIVSNVRKKRKNGIKINTHPRKKV